MFMWYKLRLASYETQNRNGETETKWNGKTKRNRKPHPKHWFKLHLWPLAMEGLGSVVP